MGAPKGNQFWKLRAKHGRDKIFASPDALWEAACDYFQWCEDNPLMSVEQARSSAKPTKDEEGKTVFPPNVIELPKMRAFTIAGLCIYLGVNTLYFSQFEKELSEKNDQISKDFSLVCTRIREIIYTQKFTGAAAGFLNPQIIARDLGLADKSELVGRGDTDLFKDKTDDELKTLLKEISSKLD